MRNSLRFRIAIAMSRMTMKPALRFFDNPIIARRVLDIFLRVTSLPVFGVVSKPQIMRHSERTVDGLRLSPKSQDPDRKVFYAHGGAFFMGSAKTHRSLAAALAKRIKAEIYLPNYALAPEKPFPHGLDDLEAAYQAFTKDYPDCQIILMGDSAGGALVFALLQRILTRGLAMPNCVVALSPVTDLRGETASIKENAGSDCVLVAKKFPVLNKIYAGGASLDNPEISPVFGQYRGAPPVLIHACEKEILCDDAAFMAQRLKQDKVDVSLTIFPNPFHVLHFLHGIVPEADAAIDQITEFIDEKLM